MKQKVNDFTYTPNSKRNWMYGMTAILHHKMEYFTVKLDNKTRSWGYHHTKMNQIKQTRVKDTTKHVYKKTSKLMALTTVPTVSLDETKYTARTIPQWDTDSGLVGIDKRCSACLSHDPDDFIGEITQCNRLIKGFGGTHHFDVFIGTLKWH